MNYKHKLFSLTAALLSAGLFSSAAQAATVTIDSLTYKTNEEDSTASVTDCPEDLAGTVTIPSSITVDGTAYTVTSIGSSAFYYCTKLTEIIIPDSVTSIGDSAFRYCDSLKEIQVSENNSSYQSIEGILFSKDATLLHTYPAGKPDTSYIIPDSVISIGNYAFFYCTLLKKIIIPDSVTSIGSYAFYWCTSLTEVIIPDSVTTIGNSAFFYCTLLKKIIIPDSVTSIGSYAFYWCTSLTEVIIPDSVTSIGDSAFYSCDLLTGIYFQSQTPPEVGSYVFDNCPENMIIYYPEGAEANWPTEWQGFATEAWDPLTYEVSEDGTASVTDCPDNFTGAVTIPSSITVDGTAYTVTDIGWSAFSGCSSLKEIIIPDSVTSIGDYAFSGCDSLTEIIIPDSVTSIGSRAFSDCTSLTEIIIPDSVTSIGSSAFYSCDSLTEIIIPDSVTSIGSSAFYSCDSLTHVTLGNGVTSIGNYAFYSCDSLTHVTLGNGVTSIGSSAFYSCDSLTEIVIPDSVTSIRYEAFSDCTSLTGIYFQSQTPPEVGSLVFSGCPSNMIIYYPAGAEANWGTEWQGFATKAWDPAVGPAPEEPSLTCGAVSKNPETGEISFTLTFTGTLQESADGITWSDVSDAAKGSHSVTVQKNQNRFFRTIVH